MMDFETESKNVAPSAANSTISSSFSDLERNVKRAPVLEVNTGAPKQDVNIIDWDGPDDSENPLNWSAQRKTAAVAIVSAITFISSLASSVFAPGIEKVMGDFRSTNKELASFVVSVYLIGYCFGPLVIAPLSEIYGRSPLYHTCNIMFVILSVACALSPNLASLIIFRFFAGFAGSCPMTLGPGTLADIVSIERRGQIMAAWVSGPLLGPVIGPIAGGYLAQEKGWRWAFWVVAITGGVVTILSFLFLRESYAYALLEKKAKMIRKATGNPHVRSILDNGRSAQAVFRLAIVRPSKMLVCSPIIFVLSLFTAVQYGYLYLIFTAQPGLYIKVYGFSTGSVGLTYIGLGVGSLLGLLIAGLASDRLVRYLTNKNGGERKPEYRIPLIFISTILIPTGLFLFGWTAESRQHWIVPITGTALLGAGITLSFMPISTYLVDAFGQYAASAVAANTVLRSLGGALLPLAGGKMYAALGLGWGSSLLAFIAVAMVPVPLVFYRYGGRIRQKNLFNVQF